MKVKHLKRPKSMTEFDEYKRNFIIQENNFW